jgi:hypothetical protein
MTCALSQAFRAPDSGGKPPQLVALVVSPRIEH